VPGGLSKGQAMEQSVEPAAPLPTQNVQNQGRTPAQELAMPHQHQPIVVATVVQLPPTLEHRQELDLTISLTSHWQQQQVGAASRAVTTASVPVSKGRL
jgi:hypothetical protein